MSREGALIVMIAVARTRGMTRKRTGSIAWPDCAANAIFNIDAISAAGIP